MGDSFKRIEITCDKYCGVLYVLNVDCASIALVEHCGNTVHAGKYESNQGEYRAILPTASLDFVRSARFQVMVKSILDFRVHSCVLSNEFVSFLLRFH